LFYFKQIEFIWIANLTITYIKITVFTCRA